MIHEPNTTAWPIGALVIHDADAKTPAMLMRVTGRDKQTGEYRTRYAFPRQIPAAWRRKVWRNDMKYLHDPARFGMKVPNVELSGASPLAGAASAPTHGSASPSRED